MPEINSMEELSELVRKGETNWSQYGEVYTNENEDLILFNYSPAAQFHGRWNWFERRARGLILEKRTGKVIAWPFAKFWNWLEGGRKAGGHIEHVTEKVDGSLGIIFEYQGKTRFATRGSLNSEQARWAFNFWHSIHPWNNDQWVSNFDPDVTLLAEIIYPENRVVVDYGDQAGLWLLGGINRKTGREVDFWSIHSLGQTNPQFFRLPKVYSFNAIEDIIAAAGALDVNQEGWVVKFTDGSRWKFKGDRYLELHKLITGLSQKRVFEAMRDNVWTDFILRVPEEFRTQVIQWHDAIADLVMGISNEISYAQEESRPFEFPRKHFAMHVSHKYPRWLQNALFQLLDGKPIDKLIWKQVEEQLGDSNGKQ